MNGLKSATLWIVIFLVFILMWVQYSDKEQPQKIDLTRVTQLAQTGKITGKITDKEGRLEGTYTNDEGKPQPFTAEYLPGEGQGGRVYDLFEDNAIAYEVKRSSPFFTQILFSLVLPLIIFIGLWFLIMRQIQGGGNKAMSFGKSRAKLMTEGQTKVTFADVAGVDEAKQELCEVVEFLRDPQKFSRLGGKIPKGVLLVGPPGTGKTLLAKAVAGEASVPFFSISGSDFVEMFVGVGASRVRDLFEQGKKHKPCLIFMDEIDAVGRHRGFGIGGGHDEREQTLNQLLVEMDGFNSNEGIILIASTNRPDVLDPALLRPGRFDRQVTVDYPDMNGREQILAVHARGAKLNRDVNLKIIAKGTPGFSGADLANLINEAALLAARRNRDDVSMEELEDAKDRVMMGPERRSLALSDSEKKLTAYHEAGHAITAKFVNSEEEVHKVTIIPRGRALGVTSYLPSEERFTLFKSKLKDRLVYMMGGRAAEEIIFGDFTTGAGNDLMRITQMARRMVCEFGMSDVLGARTYGDSNAPPVFLGRDSGNSDRDYSEATSAIIDSEIKSIVDEAHRRALQILGDNKELLIRVSEALIERETLTGDDIDILMRGESLPDLPTPEPILPPPTAPAAEEKKRKEPRLFGKPILDRPKEQPSS